MDSSSIWGTGDTHFFYQITPDIVLQAVEEFGFRCTGRVLQLNSLENRVYEVEIESDSEHRHEHFKIIKFYRPGRWSKDQILEEHQFLLDLEEAEIPVITPLKFDSQTLVPVADGQIYCAVFNKAGGRVVDELNEEQIERVGRLIGRLHIVGAKRKAIHRIKLDANTLGWQNLEYLKTHNLISLELEKSYLEVAEKIIAKAETLIPKYECIRIHGDAHIGNLIRRDTDFVFVDYDDMLFGPPVQDLWLVIPGRDEYANSLKTALLRGYESIRTFDRASLELVEYLRALRLIHFSAWIGKRWEDRIFRTSFDYYGTYDYWRVQLNALQEQLNLV